MLGLPDFVVKCLPCKGTGIHPDRLGVSRLDFDLDPLVELLD